MRAVWAASRAAVRRRKLQTVIIGIVVMLSTTTIVFALGLIAASSAPFDHAFAQVDGAHVAAAFDDSKVTADRLRATAHAPGVTAAAGPFGVAILPSADLPNGHSLEGLSIVGRAGPGGPVDRLTVIAGRWVRAPDEIVLAGNIVLPSVIGSRLTPAGMPPLTIVGVANSATETAQGWVLPTQLSALRPDQSQMLYRFSRAGTAAQLNAALSTATASLPKGALLGGEQYLTAKQQAVATFEEILPFVIVFGILGLVISVLIVANVVNGAVVSGFRHIGVMKALGFGPVQVTGVYVTMITLPAVLGCTGGLVTGNLLATAILATMRNGLSLPAISGVGSGLDVLAFAGVMGLVTVTALLPALRAGRLPATRALSAASLSQTASRSRGRRVQARLARTTLPSPVSLGLSLPLARPARTALTLAAIGLGTMAVTFGIGLHQSLGRINAAGSAPITVALPFARPGVTAPSRMTDSAVETLLRSRPGTSQVMGESWLRIHITGLTSDFVLNGLRGDYTTINDKVTRGRWLHGPGEIMVSERFLRTYGRSIGDRIDLQVNGRSFPVRIVGALFALGPSQIDTNWATMSAVAPGSMAGMYYISVTPGTDQAAYVAALTPYRATGLRAAVVSGDNVTVVVFNGLFLTFTLIMCAAAALGVLNTVVLNSRERSRDLGVLKSIGMTPWQVITMMVTSMAALGVVGGLVGVPAGVLAHHQVLELTGHLVRVGMPGSFVHVYEIPALVALGLAGVMIAVLGALLPASWAARMRTAAVLRSE